MLCSILKTSQAIILIPGGCIIQNIPEHDDVDGGQHGEQAERQSFPWLFLAEDRISSGSDVDALHFVTQNPVRTPGSRAPGLRIVTYAVADAGGPRIVTTIKIDDRRDRDRKMEGKLKAVEI